MGKQKTSRRGGDEPRTRPTTDVGSTLMHDPAEPHPWDEEGPPTGQIETMDTDAAVERTYDGPAPVRAAEIETLEEIDEIEEIGLDERNRAIAVGLVVGAVLGIALLGLFALLR